MQPLLQVRKADIESLSFAIEKWRYKLLNKIPEEYEWEYTKKYNVPHNPLYDMVDHDGLVYRSIGCYPCTKPTSKEGEERAGRSQDKEDIMEHLRSLGYM